MPIQLSATWVGKDKGPLSKEFNLHFFFFVKGHYAKCNKLNRERQIPYDLTYVWNLKKITKQNKNK